MRIAKSDLGIASLLLTAIIWGITLPLLKANLETLPPLTLAFARFLIASILAVVFSELNGLRLRDIGWIALCAIFGVTLHIGLLLFGLEKTSAVDATFLIALSPIIASLLAVATLSEKINSSHALGITAAFFGSFIYIIFPHLQGKPFSLNLTGDILVLGSVLSESVYIIGSKKLFERFRPSSISAIAFVVGMLSFFPGAVFEYVQNPAWVDHVSLFNIFSVLFLGVFSSFIAFLALEWGLSKVAVHVSATVSYLTPAIAIIIATIFLGEKLNSMFPYSVGLIVAGIYLVSKHQPKLHPHFHRRGHKV